MSVMKSINLTLLKEELWNKEFMFINDIKNRLKNIDKLISKIDHPDDLEHISNEINEIICIIGDSETY